MSQWRDNPEDQHSFSGRAFSNAPYNTNMAEGQPTHGLPSADWQPPSAYHQAAQGPPTGATFQGPPYFSPHPHAHPYHPQSPHVAGVIHGLPTWQHNQHTAPPAHSFGYRGTDKDVVAASQRDDDEPQRMFRPDPASNFQPALRFPGTPAAGMPSNLTHSAQANVTRRLDEIEERSKEGRKQRLRLEAKVDENAQTLAAILNELKAFKSQAVAVAPANPIPAGVNSHSQMPGILNAPIPRIVPITPHPGNPVIQQRLASRPLTMGDNVAPRQQIGPVQNDETEEPNSIAGEMAARISKRPAHPNQPGSLGDLSKRTKTAHPHPAAADQSNSGPDLVSPAAARSRAVFRFQPEARPQLPPLRQQQQQQQPQQQQEEAAARAEQQSNAPSAPVVEAPAPIPADNNNNNIAHDLLWAHQFLEFIKRMDCSSDRQLLSLKKCVNGRISFDFPLCTDSPTRRTKFSYFLKVGGSLSTVLTPNPENRPPGQPDPASAEAEHLNIYETYLDQRCAAATNGTFHAFHPPKYVVPLGEVYRASRSSDEPSEVVSTNFLAFMDVTGPRKSVWLMYRYERAVEDRDRVQWRPVSIHSERDSVFSSGVRTFDAVCLLEDVKGWKGPAEEMVGMGRFGEALPDEQLILHAAFYTPLLERLREALKKGWAPAVEKPREEQE